MKFSTFLIALALNVNYLYSQCTTTNATSCVCDDGTQNCLLLPDITASWKGISNNGWTEYPQVNAGTSQNGQGPDNGRLRVTGSTPNIGHGSFTVRGVDANGKRAFLCGSDTIFNVAATGNFTCPNGIINPKQLLNQRIYKKDSTQMSYVDRWTGSMAYHPSHGHNHVDDWAVMTLRIPTSDPNPLSWPIVGEGAKIGFCLMDYGQCGTSTGSTYYGHCRDENTVYNQGTTLQNVDFPNWNLGGGSYNCSVTEQGISSGWTDVYGKHLDGMWVNLPENTCNGDYYIVMEVDKNNYFQEEREDNNFTAVPVTLSLQHPANSSQAPKISSIGSNNLCSGGTVSLSVTAGSSFLWSTGETSQNITVSQAGSYSCQVTNYCGTSTSLPFTVNSVIPNAPSLIGDTVCVEGAMTLTANGTGTISWYDAQNNMLGTGSSFTTPVLNTTTQYFAENTDTYSDSTYAEPHTNGIGGGGYRTSVQSNIFNALQNFTLQSALVYSTNAGSITVQLKNSADSILSSLAVSVPAGESRVNLNFSVPADSSLKLGISSFTGFSTNQGLYRNDNSAIYPYEIPGLLSITGTTAGASYYYYLYDWEILTENGTCTSPRVEVSAVVESCAALGEDVAFKNSISLFPNPNNGQFEVNFNTRKDADVTIDIIDIVGKTIQSQSLKNLNGFVKKPIDIKNFSKGIYLMNLTFEGKTYTKRFIKD
jgi:hypothetical protein